MGIIFKEYLDNESTDCIIQCRKCATHLSTNKEVISKAFHGHFGQAYLVNVVVNVYEGPGNDREMSTGMHRVHDIFCKSCQCLLGWKYEHAYESTQRYKEGKYILETAQISQH